MTFISYAPNCEDVPLWRALQDVAIGHYLDWGDEPADGPSATRAFYDRGWTGLSVRPTATVAALAALRPRDAVLAAAPDVAAPAGRPLHFLRVGTPGAEAVLRALDLRALRPWVVLVPAGEARAVLAEAGYRFALFDGLSDFHALAGQDALLSRLAAPANVADGFLRAADWQGASRLAALEAALAAAEARVEGSSRRMADAVVAAGRARADVGLMTEESAWLRGLIDEAKHAEGQGRADNAWLRGVAADAKEQDTKSRAEAVWLRGQLDTARAAASDRSGQLLARVEEVAWLRSCVAEAEARVAAEQRGRHAAEMAAAEAHAATATAHAATATANAATAAAHAAIAATEHRMALMQMSRSWRLTAPLRRLRTWRPAGPAAP